MSFHVYLDKKSNSYYIENVVNSKKIVIINCDSNNNSFKSEEEAWKYVFEELKNSNKNVNKYCFDYNQDFLKLEKRRLKITSYVSYLYRYNLHIFPFFEKVRVSDINDDLLDVFYQEQAIKHLEKTYLKGLLTLARRYIDFILIKSKANINLLPMYIDSTYPVTNKEFDFYTEEEYIAFKSQITNARDNFLFHILFYYGLRVGELRGLKTSNFDTKNKILYIWSQVTNRACGKQIELTAKSGSSVRTFPLADTTIALLKGLKIKPKQYIFSSSDKNALVISEHIIREHYNKYRKKAKLHYIRIHDFRHSCGIHLLRSGFSINTVRSWLGHKYNSTTLDYYLKYADKEKEKVTNLIIDKKIPDTS